MTKEIELLKIVNDGLEKAREIATQIPGTDKAWMAPNLEKTIAYFDNIRDRLENGPPLLPSGGGGLGISVSLGEWAPDELVRAGIAIDSFYRKNF